VTWVLVARMETDISRTVIAELGALVVLVGYLAVSVCLRHRERWRQQREDSARAREFRRHWRPTALNVSSVQGRVDDVRRDFAVPAHYQARHAGYRIRLISSIRGAISRLPFFRSVRHDSADSHEQEKHIPA